MAKIAPNMCQKLVENYLKRVNACNTLRGDHLNDVEFHTQYMLSTYKDARCIDSQVTSNNYTFETFKEFVCLGFAFTIKNDDSLEIKHRISLANRCCYGLYDEANTLQEAHPTPASLWLRGMDAIKQRCSSLERIR